MRTKGSGTGGWEGDHSPEHAVDVEVQEEAIEVSRRAKVNLAGDEYELAEIEIVKRHLSRASSEVKAGWEALGRLETYQVEKEDPNNREIDLRSARLVRATQELRTALEARTLGTARQLIRLALSELQSAGLVAGEPELEPAA